MVISYSFGLMYFPNITKNFHETNEGSSLKNNRENWGRPDKIQINDYEIIDTYHAKFSLNEYKFFYDKKDSLLIKKWREY